MTASSWFSLVPRGTPYTVTRKGRNPAVVLSMVSGEPGGGRVSLVGAEIDRPESWYRMNAPARLHGARLCARFDSTRDGLKSIRTDARKKRLPVLMLHRRDDIELHPRDFVGATGL